ncbi:MAG: hypothetical protein HRU30_08515 [Rhodobacteraceae bacterium]|nr:hypothetical protein [Paracoccaceae bacterium]
MLSEDDIHGASARVVAKLKATYVLPGRTLAKVVRRAGRLLPSSVKKSCQTIIEAEKLAFHPKLRVAIDPAELSRAEKHVLEHLATIDVADRRKGQVLGILGAIAFNLILVVAAFIAWLTWRGYL